MLKDGKCDLKYNQQTKHSPRGFTERYNLQAVLFSLYLIIFVVLKCVLFLCCCFFEASVRYLD